MSFIDQVKVFLKAGNGGDGSLSFRREKFIEFGGPDGGCGGDGGDILFSADPNVNTLLKYRFKPHLRSCDGKHGSGRCRSGESGKDLICKVPLGTQIISQDQLLFDITHKDKIYCAAKGGKGGRGNAGFKTSTNRAPRQFTKGQPGQEAELTLSLKIIADIGLVGLPNAGKSTFLSVLSNAKPKIADYPFSTLEPSLGVVSCDNTSFVMADIPGIIKGAHCGVGLGTRFLKHIERCKFLLYLIDVSQDDVCNTYQNLKAELALYSDAFAQKSQLTILTKCDLCAQEELKRKKALLQNSSKSKVLHFGFGADADPIIFAIKELYVANCPQKPKAKFDPIQT